MSDAIHFKSLPPSTRLRTPREQSRFGIGEWYGKSFVELTPAERKAFAELQRRPKREQAQQPRPFRSTSGLMVPCTKPGGVCSLRLYSRSAEGVVAPKQGPHGRLCTTCPNRFLQDRVIFEWIGETIIGTSKPRIAGEVGFLERLSKFDQPASGDDVGRIDHVLVHPTENPMKWCAMEIQAVYFSGTGMATEFAMLLQHESANLPFPSAHRRPDFRSSGPKRLMPQLQIKVPSLRRWGKKMAVVVDESFFAALGRMDSVRDVSNCDIAWFVVGYDENGSDVKLTGKHVQLTTLERSVEGLTGGLPVSLSLFEDRIRTKLSNKRTSKPAKISADK